MAGVPFAVTSGLITTGATTGPKTLLQLTAATNHRVVIDQIDIGFFGTNSAATPVRVEIAPQTSTGTGAGAVTPTKENPQDTETLEATAAICAVTTGNWTAEPTTGAPYRTVTIHPQLNQTLYFPTPIVIVGSGTGRVGVVATADASVNCVIGIRGRE